MAAQPARTQGRYQPLSPVKSILSKNLKNASHIQSLEKEQGCKTHQSLSGCPEAGASGPDRQSESPRGPGSQVERGSCPALHAQRGGLHGLAGTRDTQGGEGRAREEWVWEHC